jgi:hypothetical protein
MGKPFLFCAAFIVGAELDYNHDIITLGSACLSYGPRHCNGARVPFGRLDDWLFTINIVASSLLIGGL